MSKITSEVFNVKSENHEVVIKAYKAFLAEKRSAFANTKTRGEVRGGGKKPWRQKGTGRARHGSTRSPIWVGGGVSGGPRNEKVYEREIPKKMRRKALFMVLSEKAKNNLFLVMDKMEMEKPKTKVMANIMKKLPCASASRLVLMNEGKNVFLSARNIAKTGVLEARNLNLVDLLKYKYVVISKDGIKEIEKTFIK
jgi:large subunit ribosomal protein L4